MKELYHRIKPDTDPDIPDNLAGLLIHAGRIDFRDHHTDDQPAAILIGPPELPRLISIFIMNRWGRTLVSKLR